MTTPLGRLLGDQMIAGRLVAMAAFAAWLALVALAARRLRCSSTNAVFGAITLAIYMFVFSDFYVGVNDPQVLGHALQALGLVILLSDRKTAAGLAAAGVLFAAGVFVKNNLIALPLAATLWLLANERSRGWRLIAVGAVAGAAGVALCVAAFGPQFAAQVMSPRALVPAKAAMMSWQWTGRMVLPLGAIVWLASRAKRDRPAGLVITYAVTSIGLGLLFALGDGVYWNTMFDADCAVALTAALVLQRAPASASGLRRLAVPAAYLAAPAIVVALAANVHWLSPRFWFDPRWSETGTAGGEIDFLRGHAGPALCEDLAFCYWAGKPVAVDFFNIQQRATHEAWRVEAIARRLDAREFEVAQIDDPGRDLGPRFTEALQRNYRIDHKSQWGVFWVPK